MWTRCGRLAVHGVAPRVDVQAGRSGSTGTAWCDVTSGGRGRKAKRRDFGTFSSGATAV